MININNLPPFKKMCVTIGNLPTSFMESMSYYEALCWMYNYLDKTVIPAINTEGEAITELQTAFTTLKSYVDNYFENLDVQEEINNKLDDMAESGELTDIIAQYLGLAGILAYSSVNAMKMADNLVNGSLCKTYGYYNINDGGGASYRVRTVTNEDVIDNATIIALSNENLVAELVTVKDEIDIKQLGGKSEIGFDNKNIINIALNKFGKVIFSDGNYYITNAVTVGSNKILSGINAKLYSDSPYIINGEEVSNVLIENLKFESTVDTSDTANMSESTADSRGYTTLSSVIKFYNSSTITIENCEIKGSFTGIFIQKSNNVIINKCNCYESSSKIICLSASHYKLTNNYIHDIKINENDYYPCYLFQSTDDSTILDQEQSILSNNRFENNINWDAIMMHRYNKISILDNTIVNVRTGIDLTITDTEALNGNIIVSNNYIEGTDTNNWGDENALNHGIIVIGDSNQSSVVISNNIVKNFGKFKSANGGCGVIIRDSNQVNFSNNIIEMDTTVNSVKAALYLRGTINELNVNNNVINGKAMLPILLYNLTSNLCVIKDNILKSVASGNTAIDTNSVVTLTKAFINNIGDLPYALSVRNGDSINGISYTSNVVYPILNQTIKSSASIESFTIPANSRVQKFINKSDINYSGAFNNDMLFQVYPKGNINADIVMTAQYGGSGDIRVEFINTSSTNVTLSTQTYIVLISL